MKKFAAVEAERARRDSQGEASHDLSDFSDKGKEVKKMKKWWRTAVATTAILTSCASAGQFERTCWERNGARVDPISVTQQEKFQRDMGECCHIYGVLLAQAQNDAAARGFFGALLGAGIGAAYGGILKTGNYTTRIAGAGAVAGATSGVASTPNTANEAFGNCMINRGYLLLY